MTKFLVYHHRHNGMPLVKKGIAAITAEELNEILAKSEISIRHGPTNVH